MNKITLNANAKINLYLDVTGKRADGYHLLETVMHTVSLCDIVTLEKIDSGITLSCSDKSIPVDCKNIAYKCAEAFYNQIGIKNSGISISIDKRIFTQAGMGGGSADGAAVLKGMNMLYETSLSDKELCQIGVKIGADIPFCIVGGCGYCTGIGDIITPLPKLNGTVLIAKGSEGISTKSAFEKIDLQSKTIGLYDVKSVISTGDLKKIAPYCRNLFDEVTNLSEVASIKKIMLDNYAYTSCLTGSGSAVFGLYRQRSEAEAAAKILNKMNFFTAICEFI